MQAAILTMKTQLSIVGEKQWLLYSEDKDKGYI